MTALAVAAVFVIAIPSLAWWHREMRRMRAHAESALLAELRIELTELRTEVRDANRAHDRFDIDLDARLKEALELARSAQNRAQLGRR